MAKLFNSKIDRKQLNSTKCEIKATGKGVNWIAFLLGNHLEIADHMAVDNEAVLESNREHLERMGAKSVKFGFFRGISRQQFKQRYRFDLRVSSASAIKVIFGLMKEFAWSQTEGQKLYCLQVQSPMPIESSQSWCRLRVKMIGQDNSLQTNIENMAQRIESNAEIQKLLDSLPDNKPLPLPAVKDGGADEDMRVLKVPWDVTWVRRLTAWDLAELGEDEAETSGSLSWEPGPMVTVDSILRHVKITALNLAELEEPFFILIGTAEHLDEIGETTQMRMSGSLGEMLAIILDNIMEANQPKAYCMMRLRKRGQNYQLIIDVNK